MQEVQFVYFDLDDTLLDHRRAERLALADVCRAFPEQFSQLAVEAVQETYHKHNVVLWRRYAHQEISRSDLRRLRFEQLLEALAIEGMEPGTLNDYYLDCYARYWRFSEGARQAFHAIADHLPVGVLTNGFADVQRAKLARFPEIHERLSVLVISEEVGYMKPHSAIFDHAAEQASVAPGALLYVGDSYESDVKGARRAGWQVAWFNGDAAKDDTVFPFRRWEALAERLLQEHSA